MSRAVAGDGPHDRAHERHAAGQLRERLQVAGRAPPALERGLAPLPRALEEQYERHALLGGEVDEAPPLLGGAEPDRASEHAEVLGADEHRPAVHEAVAGDEAVGRHGVDHAPVHRPDERAELDERAGVEQGVDAGAGVEPPPGALALEVLGAAHGRGALAPRPQVVEEGIPIAHVITRSRFGVATPGLLGDRDAKS